MNIPFRTPAQLALNFDKESGIEIQSRQLKEFESILIPEAFAILRHLVTANNHRAFDGFDVVRGVDIHSILMNEVIPFLLAKE